MKDSRRAARARRGSESIEAAIAVPLLLLVIFAACEYGWLVLKSTQLDGVARLGARAASLEGATAASVEAKVRDALGELGIVGAQINFQPRAPEHLNAGMAITVRIDARYAPNQLLGLARLMPIPDTMKGSAAMVLEPRSN
ncbi:MAG: pilus assembly protein [Planctomycetes bacterium]|nr:pilus assembly protein [Planctomycetota bacterium]